MDPKNQQNADPVAKLRDQLAGLKSEQSQIANTALARGDGLTTDENKRLKEIEAATAQMADNIERLTNALAAQSDLAAPLPSAVSGDLAAARASATPMPVPGATSATYSGHTLYGRDVAATSPTHGFESALAWYKSIKTASVNPALTDRRLTNAQAAATTYANEGAGTEGGWAQPTEFSKEIVELVAGQASLLGRMKPIQSSSNVYQLPVDPTTGWGTTGVQAAGTAEGGASTVSNLALQSRVVTLFKATSLVNVSEELASDNPATITYINRVMARQLQGIVERWLLRGNGVNEPLGILNAPALVSVDKDTSQTAATITKTNLSKMIGRLLPGSADAFCVCSPSAHIGMIDILLNANGNRGSDLQGGFTASALGYPCIVSMEAQPIGTAGDCTMVAPSGFVTLTRGGVNTQVTPYFYFDQGLNTLRAYIRIGQVPLLAAAIAPKLDTSTTLSHCVTTAVRS